MVQVIADGFCRWADCCAQQNLSVVSRARADIMYDTLSTRETLLFYTRVRPLYGLHTSCVAA
jgi:hypothetical protein